MVMLEMSSVRKSRQVKEVILLDSSGNNPIIAKRVNEPLDKNFESRTDTDTKKKDKKMEVSGSK